jgi:hypothetical protein
MFRPKYYFPGTTNPSTVLKNEPLSGWNGITHRFGVHFDMGHGLAGKFNVDGRARNLAAAASQAGSPGWAPWVNGRFISLSHIALG